MTVRSFTLHRSALVAACALALAVALLPVTAHAAAVATLAGSGTAGHANGSGTAATFNQPGGIAVDASGNVYVADGQNASIRKIDSTGAVTALAGYPDWPGTNAACHYMNGTGAAAGFCGPSSVVLDGSGNLYVADTGNSMIRKIVIASGAVTTLAGGGGAPEGLSTYPSTIPTGSTNGTGTAATFNQPSGIAIDASGTNLYVADTFNHLIRKIVIATGAVSTFAGSGSAGSNNATGAAATFNRPGGIAVDSSGNVYVADTGNHLIRKITPAGLVSTYAGGGSVGGVASGSADGVGTAATFNMPVGLAFGAAGVLYVADAFNNLIRKIDTGSGVTTLVGGGSAGGIASGRLDGNGTAATLNTPVGVFAAAGVDGDVYVADMGNNLIRKLTFLYHPGLVSSVPAGGATGVAAGRTTLTLNFSEAMLAVSGNLRIVNESDTTTETIAVTNASKLAWSNGNQTLTITLGTALVAGKSYHVEIDATAFTNAAAPAVAYAGIATTTELRFSTTGAPEFSAISPASNGFIKRGATLGYTLSATAASGFLTFTRSGGTADPASPHTCTLSGAALTSGAHTLTLSSDCGSAPTLVDGAVYTIGFSATDSVPLTGTTSISGVTFDATAPAIHATTPIAMGDADRSGSYSQSDTLTLQFAEPVATASVTLVNLALSGGHSLGSGATLVAQSASGGYAQSYLITLGAGPTVAVGDTLTMTAANVLDRAGNPAASAVVFTVPALNTRPTATVNVIAGTPQARQTVTGSYTYSDAESDPQDTSSSGTRYRWLMSGSTTPNLSNVNSYTEVVSGTTGGSNTSYTLGPLVGSGTSTYLFYCVTPQASSGTASGTEVCSSASARITAQGYYSGDGVPNALNASFGDGNGDGILDKQQAFVYSLATAQDDRVPRRKRWATFEASPNTLTITNVSNTADYSNLGRGRGMKLGQFGFTVTGLANGGTATMSMLVDSSLGMRGYLKQKNGQTAWDDISTSTTVFGRKTKITFEIVDGGPYDSDGIANGRIVDPGGMMLDLLNRVVPENTTYVGEMSETLALNAGFAGLQGAVSYAVTGSDAAKFAIDATSGSLRFIAAPDFETPASAAHSNIYSLTVTATGATNGSASENVTVTVLNDVGSAGVIANLGGDRTVFTPGTAEYINSGTAASIGVFSGPISGYLLIDQVGGTEDGSFTLGTGLPGTIAVDGTLDGSSGKSLQYTLTAASTSDIATVINKLKYDAPTAGERRFSVILNNGTAYSEAVTFTMTGNGNGACGPADKTSVASAPSANLCASGMATAVTGLGPWNWACVGSGNSTTNAACSATVGAPPVTGIPLTVPPKVDTGVTTTVLAKDLSSGQGPAMVVCLADALTPLLGATATYQGQNADGSARYSLATNPVQILSFYPTDASTASSGPGVALTGTNVLTVSTSCGTLSTVPALFNRSEFAALLSTMGLSANINDQGVITIQDGNTIYVGRPDYAVTKGTPGAPSLTQGADGLYRFTDSAGNVQILRPAFLEPAVLKMAVGAVLGSQFISLVVQTDGTGLLTMFVNGANQTDVLTPALTLGTVSADHWVDSVWGSGSAWTYRVYSFPNASQGVTAVLR